MSFVHFLLITKTRLFKYIENFTSKKFFILLLNIDCGYLLELPRWGSSNEYPQSMFWAEIWKIIILGSYVSCSSNNPFTSSELSYHNSLDWSTFNSRVSGEFLLLLCFIEIPVFNANRVDSDLDAAFWVCLVCHLPFRGSPDWNRIIWGHVKPFKFLFLLYLFIVLYRKNFNFIWFLW